ncbi:MAG: DNA mismatch repair protein MutS [Methanomicrobiaceae archaeon]|nr:DNA mismatch repair protein MutS [Methanomicrobiaceae archaeon]
MSKGPTPAMKQFYEMKSRYPDCVLFFQMGDFYETFGEDAELVARELDITLTARGKDKNGDRMPLAGVPIHAGDTYVARLIQKGYRVAICDQIEDPKTAKGVVRRDVVRVVTPGTVIDSGMINSSNSTYLMAATPDRRDGSIGMAFLDISTGEFFVEQCGAGNGAVDVFSGIARNRPTECIIPPGFPADIRQRMEHADVLVTVFRHDAFDEETAKSLLIEQFSVSSLDGFGCEGMHAGIAAAGACLAYAKETQMTDLAHINRLQTRIATQTMALDAITLRNLEICHNIRKHGDDATLVRVLDESMTPMGGRLLRAWITSPLIDPGAINARLDAVAFFAENPLIRNGARSLLHRCADVERIAGRISYGNAGPRDLRVLNASLEKIPPLAEYCRGGDAAPPALIGQALEEIADLAWLRGLIEQAIVDDPPPTVRQGGVIREGYDESLDTLRSTATGGRSWIAEFQANERERTGIKSLKVGYNKVFGYYIEVTKPNLRLVPPEYRRKQTTANGERYTIPVLQEKEAMIANAEERLGALEAELYEKLIEKLRTWVPDLQATARALGTIDVFAGLAEVARKNGYTRPEITDDAVLVIREGRHPVVERSLAHGFVPNDTVLDSRNDQILIITGANMAGKSTYMRGVALICIMAQAGSFVPANFASVGIVDRVFTRVGAFDDLASGQSTFMVEMLELANILNNVSPRSLVILDEIGRGTSTLDGLSIARAVLEYLHGRGSEGPRTLFATHFHELIETESELKRVKNYHFAVKDTGKEVVFLRKIIPGATDRSYGIHVARLAGIPIRVTARAEDLLKKSLEEEYRPTGKKSPRYTQMLLIDSPEMQSADHALIEEIRSLDINTITPVDALTALHALQRKAHGRSDQP